MKVGKLIKYIDALSIERPYKMPPSIFTMVAIYRYSGLDLSELYQKSAYFNSNLQAYSNFIALPKKAKTEYYSQFHTQLEYCRKLLNELERGL